VAISENNCCQITYNPASKETISELVVNPYMIVFHKGALYCIVNSQKHKGYIFLAIQRIIKVNTLDNKFKRSKDFDLQKLCKGRFGIYGHENLKLRRVVLKFSKDVAGVVAERVWHESQKIKHHRDGSITLEMKLFITDELRGWVASWLNNVKVVSPKGLKSS